MPVRCYIRIHRRPTCWRVAVIFPDTIRWRCYRRAAYPTPDDVLRRVIAGLSASPQHPRQQLSVQSWGWLTE